MEIRLLEQAAAAGHAEAQYALGTAFLMGEGVPQDADRAVALFERAAEQGDPRAQCNLGAMYAQGIGVPHDYMEAKRWYEKSAAQENPDGLYNLGVVYAQGLGGCKKDIGKARELCQKAADQGQEKARAMLPSLVENCMKGTGKRSSPNKRTSKAEPELPLGSPLHATGRGGAADRAAEVTESCREGAAEAFKDLSGGNAPATNSSSTVGGSMANRSLKQVLFKPGRAVHLQGPSGTQWSCNEVEACFPKKGTSQRFRKLFKLSNLATEDEVASILRIARSSLEFNVDNDSVDQRPTYERYVVQIGQFVHGELEQVLRPIIEDRILPYVRRLYQAPDAVVCTVLVRRYLPDERRVHPTHLDGHSFCTAVLGLNAGEYDGGLYVQPHADSKEREFVPIGLGDLAVHQYDLPHGVRVFDGRRYSIIFWIKDSIHSCVTNATPWYEAAAKAGDADAMTALAQKLNRGMNHEGVGSDPAEAVRWYRAAADLGQVEAQTNLGALYEIGRGGLPVDGREAIRWWRTAAEAGDSTAQRMLALAYSNGSCGLRKSNVEAVRWMTAAAEREDSDAMYWLSVCYNRGVGIAQDLGQAVLWAQRAADMGHPEAQCSLGSIYLTGDGIEQSLEQAAVWFRRAGLNGNAAAQCNLGAFYAQGLGGLQQSYVEALHWYQMSAEKGNADAQHNLALMYSQGLGVQQDGALARAWCQQAAEQGQAKAITMLQTLPLAAVSSVEAEASPHVATGDDVDKIPASVVSEPGSSMPAEEEPLAAKVSEVQDLLSHIRASNASSDHARQLLDQLLERAGTLGSSLHACTHRGACGRPTSQPSTIPPKPASPPSMSSTARLVEEIDASQYTAPELGRHCQGRREPLLVRRACAAAPDVLDQAVAIAGKDTVEWEVQSLSGSRLLRGSLQGCLEPARRGQPGNAMLILDGQLLSRPELPPFMEVPLFLAENDFTERLPEELRPVSQSSLIIGSDSARSQLHRDPPWISWNRLLLGTIHWRLLPPTMSESSSMPRPVGLCGAAACSLDAFANQDAWTAVQEAGDVLLIPPGWWRQSLYASGLTAAVSSQILDEQAMPGMLRCLQTSAGVTHVPLTGHLTADVRRVAGVLAGKMVEQPDQRAALSTREAAPAVRVVARPLQNLESAEFVD